MPADIPAPRGVALSQTPTRGELYAKDDLVEAGNVDTVHLARPHISVVRFSHRTVRHDQQRSGGRPPRGTANVRRVPLH